MANLVNLEEFLKVGIRLNATHNQAAFINKIRENIITFAYGQAGTGKTYIAIVEGIRSILTGKDGMSQLVFVRPAVEAEENLGFLPGTADEKIEPFMAPLWINAKKILGNKVNDSSKYISTMSLAFLRGITFDNCYVILDEAQNTTISQMKLFLTRIGKNCKVVVVGDTKQSDIGSLTGLGDAVTRFKNVSGIGICKLTNEDNMRSAIVNRVICAYEGLDETEAKKQFSSLMEDAFPKDDEIQLLDENIVEILVEQPASPPPITPPVSYRAEDVYFEDDLPPVKKPKRAKKSNKPK